MKIKGRILATSSNTRFNFHGTNPELLMMAGRSMASLVMAGHVVHGDMMLRNFVHPVLAQRAGVFLSGLLCGARLPCKHLVCNKPMGVFDLHTFSAGVCGFCFTAGVRALERVPRCFALSIEAAFGFCRGPCASPTILGIHVLRLVAVAKSQGLKSVVNLGNAVGSGAKSILTQL